MEDKYSGKKIDVNEYTRRYMDSILIEERLIDSVLPTIETNIFGHRFSSPIMTPAFSHLKAIGTDRDSAMVEYARAAKELNILNWVGMEPDDLMGEILAVGAKTVRIIRRFWIRSVLRRRTGPLPLVSILTMSMDTTDSTTKLTALRWDR